MNLERRNYTCGYFQLVGLPCCHAIAAIYKCGRKIEDYIDKCYWVETFNKIYEHCLEPVEGEEMWPISEKPRPEAPDFVNVRMPGRPKKNDRRREETEKPKPTNKMSKHGTVITCSLYNTPGHNKGGCKKNPERGKKRNAHLVRTTKKSKASEVI